MRIAHLLLTSHFAGSERHALELAAAQAAAGHEVTMVLRRAGAGDRADAIAHRLDPALRVALVGDIAPAWQARRLLRRLRPEVAHAHLSGGCRALHGIDGCLRVATLHIRYKSRQHAALDGLVAIAPWQLAAIPPLLRARSVQIDNWTLPKAPAPGARERLRGQHGITPQDFVIGALGRVEYGKGLDVLLEAFRRAHLPQSRLVIVGQGREWRRLRKMAPQAVLMPGFADAPQEWLAAFDGFASAARSEPFGLVLLEAMQAGLPIVASASEGARHLAPLLGRSLVPCEDVSAFAAEIRALIEARPGRIDYDLSAFRIEAKSAQVEAFYREGLRRLRG